MTALIVLGAMIAIAVLAMVFGADSRPGIERPAEAWLGQRR